MTTPAPREAIGSRRDRFLLILVGVVAGYVASQLLEDRFGWKGAGMLTMPVGGLIAGVVGRFTLARFRS